MILIVANQHDEHVPYVEKKLKASGAQYFSFDPEHFPSEAQISLNYERSGSVRRSLKYREREIDLDQVTAVWNRARSRPVADPRVSSENQWWVAEGCSRFLAELWECLDRLWIPNRPIADRDPHRHPIDDEHRVAQPWRLGYPSAYNKLHQLTVAGQLGFRIPRTVVTNSPDHFLEFYESNNGALVSKKATPLRTTRGGQDRKMFTYPIQRRDVAAYQSIRYAPTAFQEKIPKKLELRVTVVGKEVFPAAIRSQESRLLRNDWRHYPDFGGDKYYFVAELAADVKNRCIRLVEALGLCFGAIDLIQTPEDEYVFLEVNPNGQWAWIEDYTGLPISDAIAGLLTRGAV